MMTMEKMVSGFFHAGSLLLALFAAISLSLAPAVTVAETPSSGEAEAIVNKLQAVYASTEDYAASFVQTTAHKMFGGRLQRAYGKVTFKRGGLMRWEYQRPEKKLFIYDGRALWIYEPDVPQVFTGSADTERLHRALAFLTGEQKILDEYSATKLDAAKLGFPEGVVLGLVPKGARSPFRRVELYLDLGTYRVVRSVVVDQDGNRNRLDFGAPAINRNPAADLFVFTPPPGVPVVSPE